MRDRRKVVKMEGEEEEEEEEISERKAKLRISTIDFCNERLRFAIDIDSGVVAGVRMLKKEGGLINTMAQVAPVAGKD